MSMRYGCGRKYGAMMMFATVCVVALSICETGAGLRFYLNNNEERCFTFDAEPGTKQRGEAKVERKSLGHGTDALKDEEREIDVRVVSTVGMNQHSRSPHVPHLYSARLRGSTKFSFVTPHRHHHDANSRHYGDEDEDVEDDEDDEDEMGMGGNGPRAGYKACVRLTRGTSAAVKFVIRGIESSNSMHPTEGNTATDNAVKGISIAMREMHNTLTHLTRDISRLQQREHTLMAHNNSVGSRVVTFAIISLLILLASTALQVAYFSKFFKQKKLL